MRLTEAAARPDWLKELYDRFAPIREEGEPYSEEEIDEAIQAAVAASRKAHAPGSL